MAQMTMDQLQEMLAATREQWESVRAEPDLNFDRELEWTMQVCEKNDFNIKYALGNPDSVKAAFLNIAMVGVTIDPERKFAYILPRDSGMAYDVSYMGLINCAIKDGAIQWAQARLVYESEEEDFELVGYDRPPVHKIKPFAKKAVRGEVIGAYCVVKTPGGDYLTNTMSIEEINDIRARSPAWKAGKGPWKTDEGEMQKKTTVNQGHKYWPRSARLDRAIHYLNTAGEQGIDLNSTETGLRDQWRAKVEGAKTSEELRALLTEARGVFREAEDLDGYNAIRDLIAKRAGEFGAGKPAATPAPSPAPTPAPSPAPTPAPTPAPAKAARSPKPAATPAPTPAPAPTLAELLTREPGKVDAATVGKMMTQAVAEATTEIGYAQLEACGPFIDALPADAQEALNDQYNAELENLKKKFGDA